MSGRLQATRRDVSNTRTLAALAHLEAARDARIRWDAACHVACTTFGDHGPLISGVVRDHFPDAIKDRLRFYARLIGEQTDQAVRLWQQAGRRIETLRPRLQDARRLPDGRVSYY